MPTNVPKHSGCALRRSHEPASPLGRAARSIVLAAVLCAQPGLFVAAENYALVIGTNSYQSVGQIPDLTYPERDVDELKAALEGQGFIVTALKRDMANREWIIRELARLAMTLQKDDQFLLAFSGHGVRNERLNKETYWLTYNTQLGSLDVSGIRLKHLLDYVRDIPADRKLVLLDHCFSGNITLNPSSDGPNLDASTPSGAAAPKAPAGTPGLDAKGQTLEVSMPDAAEAESAGLVLLSASYGFAFESTTWQHGVFTKAVLEAIAEFKADQPVNHGDGDGQVSVSELINYVEKRVSSLATERHLSQRVVPQQVGTRGIAEWIIAKHPPDEVGDVSLIPKYQASLREWREQGWITIDAFIDSLSILEVVTESGHTHIALTPEQDRKYRNIREVMAATGRTAREKARALDVLFTTNGERP
jgi:hypothetical protein